MAKKSFVTIRTN